MKTIKVLVVDDHLEVRKTLRDVLELDKRIKVVGQARNGEEAISKTKKLGPNVVIMDFKMPKMNGLQAAYYIKKSHPATKVVLLSLDKGSGCRRNSAIDNRCLGRCGAVLVTEFTD